MITPSSHVSIAGRIGWLATSNTDDAAPFVGRVAELARVRALFAAGAPVVQIVGPSGMGKTRLARQFVRERRGDFAGTWVCDVRALREPDDVLVAIVRAVLGTPRAAVPDPRRAVARVLPRRGRALLVLDDVDAVSRAFEEPLAALLRAAPEARILLTAQRPLAEIEQLTLGPLPVADAAGSEAYELFLTRLRALRPALRPTRFDQLAMVALCQSLRGVPLAIEMAAARAATDGPTALVDVAALARQRLEQREPAARVDALLSSEDAATAVADAFSLLPRTEREALCQCTVFEGSFGLDAVRSVLRLSDAGAGPADVIVSLARRNLLLTTQLGPLRFAMGACIKAHAAEILDQDLGTWEVGERHARAFAGLADALATLDPRRGAAWLTDAQEDRENFALAMRFAARAGAPAMVLRLAAALDAMSGGAGVGRDELAAVGEALQSGTDVPAALRASGHAIRARALLSVGCLTDVRSAAEPALAFASDTGDGRLEGAMQLAIGQACFQLGEMPEAQSRFQRALKLVRARGDRPATSAVLQQLGAVTQSLGDAEAALGHYQAALSLAVAAQDGPTEARAAMGLGSYHLERGDLAAARSLYDRARELTRSLRMERAYRIVTGYLGVLAFDAGEVREAEALLAQAASASGAVGDLRVEGIFEGVRGAVLAALDQADDARRSFGRSRILLGNNPFFAGVIDLHRAHLDLAEARAAAASGDLARVRSLRLSARLRIEDAHAPGDVRTGAADGDERSLFQRSDDARIAVRILERALAARSC